MNPAAQLAAFALAIATVAGGASAAPAPATAAATPSAKPAISWDPIPFGAERKRDMRAYSKRHYGESSYQLKDPKVIVEHYTESATWQSAFNTFAPNVADGELGELPGVCAHFIVDEKGVIHQLVSIKTRCRHTVGLNWTAIGIEHVGFSDGEVLGDAKQMKASLALTCWLRYREGIALKNVIGHNESLRSPFHKENVAVLRTQTHGDFRKASMKTYRARVKERCGG